MERLCATARFSPQRGRTGESPGGACVRNKSRGTRLYRRDLCFTMQSSSPSPWTPVSTSSLVKTANLLMHDEPPGPALMILKNLARQNLEQPRCKRNDDSANTMGSIRGSVWTPRTTPTWHCIAPRSWTCPPAVTGPHQEERQGRHRVGVLVVRE